MRPTHSKTARRRPPSVHRGMTLIEVMIALSIITTSMLGLGAFLPNFMHVSAQGTILSAASDLAVTRIETIKAWPTYATLQSTFAGTQSNPSTCTGCSVVTVITHTSTAIADYETVSVTVSGPNIVTPVEKTTAIASF